jgi:hypothetical protein
MPLVQRGAPLPSKSPIVPFDVSSDAVAFATAMAKQSDRSEVVGVASAGRDVQRGADGEGKLCGIAVPVVDSLCARDVEANVGWHLI